MTKYLYAVMRLANNFLDPKNTKPRFVLEVLLNHGLLPMMDSTTSFQTILSHVGGVQKGRVFTS